MAYTKTNWQNGVTPINEENLNKIENELEDLDTRTRTVNVTTAGTDLNNYITDGKWYFNIANTPLNRPEAPEVAGYLEVLKRGVDYNSNDLMQRWTTYSTGTIYIRIRAGGTWGEWKKIITENDINIITAYLKENYVIANNDTVEYLANFDEYNKVGNKLTIENGKIKIGAGVSKVKVSYFTTTRSDASTVRTFTYIVHNAKDITQESHYYATLNSQISVSHNAIVRDVSQGDTFDVAVYGAVGNKVMGGPKTSLLFTSITVEVIK